jgi:hypothetical protein
MNSTLYGLGSTARPQQQDDLDSALMAIATGLPRGASPAQQADAGSAAFVVSLKVGMLAKV